MITPAHARSPKSRVSGSATLLCKSTTESTYISANSSLLAPVYLCTNVFHCWGDALFQKSNTIGELSRCLGPADASVGGEWNTVSVRPAELATMINQGEVKHFSCGFGRIDHWNTAPGLKKQLVKLCALLVEIATASILNSSNFRIDAASSRAVYD